MNNRELTILNAKKQKLKAYISQQMALKKANRNLEAIQDAYKRIENINKWKTL